MIIGEKETKIIRAYHIATTFNSMAHFRLNICQIPVATALYCGASADALNSLQNNRLTHIHAHQLIQATAKEIKN